MLARDDLKGLVMEALKERGKGTVLEVCKYIWKHHEADLRDSGDLFYKWQYDVRWAAQKLRDSGKIIQENKRSPWVLVK